MNPLKRFSDICILALIFLSSAGVYAEGQNPEKICNERSKNENTFYLGVSGSAVSKDLVDTVDSSVWETCTNIGSIAAKFIFDKPKSCEGFTDPHDGKSVGFPDAMGDLRRCMGEFELREFKNLVYLLTTGDDDYNGETYHHYRLGEHKKFVEILNSKCSSETLLSTRYNCFEKEGIKFFDRIQKASEAVDFETLKSNQDFCSAMNEQKFSDLELDFIGRVSESHKTSYQGKLKPQYCSQVASKAIFKSCTTKNLSLQNLKPEQKACLIQTLTVLSENTKPKASQWHGYKYFTSILERLKSSSLRLDTYSRLCLTHLDFNRLFEDGEADLSPENQRRCQTGEIKRLTQIKNPLVLTDAIEKELFPDENKNEEGPCPPVQNGPLDEKTQKNLISMQKKVLKKIELEKERSSRLNYHTNPELVSDEVKEGSHLVTESESIKDSKKEAPKNDEKLNEKDLAAKKEEKQEKIVAMFLNEKEVQEAKLEQEQTAKEVDAGKPAQNAKPKEIIIPPLRSKAELIREAQEILEDFKNKKNLDKYDLGRFIMEAELDSKDALSKIRWREDYKKYESKKQEYREKLGSGDLPFLEKSQKLVSMMNPDFTVNYSRELARLTDFIEGRGGDCGAQSKLLMAYDHALGLKPDAGWVLGVQNFTDHLQLVAYNKEKNEVISLLSNELKKGVVTEIYDPLVFIRGYLKSQHESVDLSSDDLLIAKANIKSDFKSHSGDPNNENLVLDDLKSSGSFSNAPIPLRATIAPPSAEPSEKLKSQNPMRGVAEEKMKSGDSNTELSKSEKEDLDKKMREGLTPEQIKNYMPLAEAKKKFGLMSVGDTSFFPLFKPTTILMSKEFINDCSFCIIEIQHNNGLNIFSFREQKDLIHFNNLTSDSEKMSFLLTLLIKQMDIKIHSKSFQDILKLYKNLEIYINLPKTLLKDPSPTFADIEQLMHISNFMETNPDKNGTYFHSRDAVEINIPSIPVLRYPTENTINSNRTIFIPKNISTLKPSVGYLNFNNIQLTPEMKTAIDHLKQSIKTLKNPQEGNLESFKKHPKEFLELLSTLSIDERDHFLTFIERAGDPTQMANFRYFFSNYFTEKSKVDFKKLPRGIPPQTAQNKKHPHRGLKNGTAKGLDQILNDFEDKPVEIHITPLHPSDLKTSADFQEEEKNVAKQKEPTAKSEKKKEKIPPRNGNVGDKRESDPQKPDDNAYVMELSDYIYYNGLGLPLWDPELSEEILLQNKEGKIDEILIFNLIDRLVLNNYPIATAKFPKWSPKNEGMPEDINLDSDSAVIPGSKPGVKFNMPAHVQKVYIDMFTRLLKANPNLKWEDLRPTAKGHQPGLYKTPKDFLDYLIHCSK